MAVTSAWWVPYSQIQRKEGGYDVRGKKNYLPPVMLVLGYGILWTAEDEETMERHARPLINENSDANNDRLLGEAAVTDIVEVEDEIREDAADANAGESDESDGGASIVDEVDQNDITKGKDKYSLDQYGSASEDDISIPETQSTVPPTATKRHSHISAKQRRDLKKGKTVQNSDESDDSEIDDVAASSINAMSVSKSKPGPKVRGKKAKLKKMKVRYAEQSDEERELARKLLGTKGADAATSRQLGALRTSEGGVTPQELSKEAQPSQPQQPPKPVVDEPLEVDQLAVVTDSIGARSIAKRFRNCTKIWRYHFRCRDGVCTLVSVVSVQIQS
jgi:hypothetical protein